jgi:hypothetical protein
MAKKKERIEIFVRYGGKYMYFIPEGKMTKDLLWSLWNEIKYKLRWQN